MPYKLLMYFSFLPLGGDQSSRLTCPGPHREFAGEQRPKPWSAQLEAWNTGPLPVNMGTQYCLWPCLLPQQRSKIYFSKSSCRCHQVKVCCSLWTYPANYQWPTQSQLLAAFQKTLTTAWLMLKWWEVAGLRSRIHTTLRMCAEGQRRDNQIQERGEMENHHRRPGGGSGWEAKAAGVMLPKATLMERATGRVERVSESGL